MDGFSLERLGNLHLVLLHLPIGFVVAAVMLEGRRWRRPSPEADSLQSGLLAVNAGVALLTAGAGWLLAASGDYAAQTLEWHRWSGVGCAVLAAAAWLAQIKGGKAVARVALALLFAATVVAGHLGATLTHGAAGTTFWGVAASEPPKPEVVATTLKPPGDGGAEIFAKEVWPVLERSCVDCHGPDKAKGRLRLDSREAVLAGGRSGRAAVVPLRPEQSELLRRVKLPREDDEAMPSGDDPALSEAEIAALEKWIAAGAAWR
jgi:mono/diheme cytochrome c family protein